MTTEITVSILSAINPSGTHEPAQTAYFAAVLNDVYIAHHLPNGWKQPNFNITGVPYRKTITIKLPDYIQDTPFGLRSDYTAQDGNADIVFIYCKPVKATNGFESAIDAAINTLIVTAPTDNNKREKIPFKIISVSESHGDID